MTGRSDSNAGLLVIADLLECRFEFDTSGRILHRKGVGVSPRFVLGRAAEGCIWRFRVDIGQQLVGRLARLAGREAAFPFDGERPAPEPERLVMIERLLGVDRAKQSTRHERVSKGGVPVGELWEID